MPTSSMRVATGAAGGTVTTEELWQEFSDRLRGFISSRVSDPDAVEDILQDVYVKIHRRSDTLNDSTRLTSWVYQVTRNAIIDHYRSAPRRREVVIPDVADDVAAADEVFSPSDAARREISSCLRPLLRQLPASYREALELVELGGLTQADAARRVGVSVSGMKSRVQRGRAHLHRTLNHWCDITVDARGGPLSCDPGNDTVCGATEPTNGSGGGCA